MYYIILYYIIYICIYKISYILNLKSCECSVDCIYIEVTAADNLEEICI